MFFDKFTVSREYEKIQNLYRSLCGFGEKAGKIRLAILGLEQAADHVPPFLVP